MITVITKDSIGIYKPTDTELVPEIHGNGRFKVFRDVDEKLNLIDVVYETTGTIQFGLKKSNVIWEFKMTKQIKDQ